MAQKLIELPPWPLAQRRAIWRQGAEAGVRKLGEQAWGTEAG